MSLIAIFLLLLSSFAHAGWNYIGKKSIPSTSFFFIANTTGVLYMSPILIYGFHIINLFPIRVLVFQCISGFFLAAYMSMLGMAYHSGEVSIEYPIIRSISLIFITFISYLIQVDKSFTIFIIGGIILTIFGSLSIRLQQYTKIEIQKYFTLSNFPSLMASIWIAGYTSVDYYALKILKFTGFGPLIGTLLYQVLEGISTSFWMLILILLQKKEKVKFSAVIHGYLGAAALSGFGIYLAYGLVLLAMNYVKNVTYVAAFRQLSIPIGALLGIFLLKEPVYIPKTIGIIFIFIGVILISLF